MTRVAIIGGGCAGLGAAATLLEKSSARVCLVEALDRMGGRARTYSPALPVDLGAEAIEGPWPNPWMAIAKTLKIGTDDANQDDQKYRISDGRTWSDEDRTPGIDLVKAALEVGYQARREKPNLPILGSSTDWGETPPEMVSLALSSSALASLKESAEPWQFVAADMYRQEGLQKDAGGEPQFVRGGLGELVEAYADSLVKTFGDRFEIRLNTVAEAIDCTSGNVQLQTGTVVPSDFAIVTAPVSTLLRIAFTPPLSYERIAAVCTVRLGSYKKVGFRPTLLPYGKEEIDPGSLYYVYDRRLRGSWQYSRLPTDKTVLVCVASGNFAARLDGMADSDVQARLLKLLGKAHSSGNFTPQPGANQQPAVAISNWSAQDFIRGAYSYTSYDGGPPDDPTPLNARARIAVPHGRAYFAGEALKLDNYGTIGGAYLSGQEAATNLIMSQDFAGMQ